MPATPWPSHGPPAVELDAAIRELRQRMVELQALCRANRHHTDDPARAPDEALRWLAGAGLLSAPLPPAHGGLGLNRPGRLGALLDLLAAVGEADLSVGRLYEGHVNALLLVEQFGSPEQRARHASDARQGALFGVWNTEAGDGVRLTPVGERRYRLSGAKTFASGAGVVKRALITGALPDGGRQMALVPMDAVSVSVDPDVWQPLGMRASISHRVDFEGVEIDQGMLLGEPGDYTREPWFTGGAVRFCAVQVGAMAALLFITAAHLKRLGRGADPHQQARVGEMATLLAGARAWFQASVAPAQRAGEDPAGLMHHARMMRRAVERAATETLQLAERSVGVQGMLAPHPLERWIRDLTTYLRQPAPDAMLAAVGRCLLEDDDA